MENDFPVSKIRDFRQFSSRRWRKLRIYIRFDENQKDSLILSCLIPTDHSTNFAYPPHFNFLHGGQRLGFSAIPVVVVVVVIYVVESYENSFRNAPSDGIAPSARITVF